MITHCDSEEEQLFKYQINLISYPRAPGALVFSNHCPKMSCSSAGLATFAEMRVDGQIVAH